MSKPASPIVTIDGPSGSGKGTISRAIARQLGWHLLDSGALYRLVALAGSAAGLAGEDVSAHADLARRMDAAFSVGPDGSERITLAGRDVTTAIRSEEAGQGASRVAAWPAVRRALLERQRAFAAPPGLVADGRDMGTVIFPDATQKIYLTASAEARAQRRYKQLIEKGFSANMEDLVKDLTERDARDAARAAAPLKPAPEAYILDTSEMGIEQAVQTVLDVYAAKIK